MRSSSPILLPGNTALAIIDLQRYFADPQHPCRLGNAWTKSVADKTLSLIPAFRAAGAKIYLIYYQHDFMQNDKPDFYRVLPSMADATFRKYQNSAFDICYRDSGGEPKQNFKETLQKEGIENILFCGVNLTVCVTFTALAARVHLPDVNVAILRDLSADNEKENPLTERTRVCRRVKEYLGREGIATVSSGAVLKTISK